MTDPIEMTEEQMEKLEAALAKAISLCGMPLNKPHWYCGYLYISRPDGLACVRMDPEYAGVARGYMGVDIAKFLDGEDSLDFDYAEALVGDFEGLAGKVLLIALRNNDTIDRHLQKTMAT